MQGEAVLWCIFRIRDLELKMDLIPVSPLFIYPASRLDFKLHSAYRPAYGPSSVELSGTHLFTLY